MAKRKTPNYQHGRKPPPPIRTGPTRSTFDGCAVTAFAMVGGVLATAGGVIWGLAELFS